MATLPEEFIEDILSRLPVKSLLRFKSASNKWYFLVSQNHKFAGLNLKQSLSSSKHLIIYQLITVDGDIFRYTDVISYESRKINFQVEIGRPCRIIGSANGLICVASPYKSDIDCCCIWNPCTGEYKTIYVPISTRGYSLIGFGYDSISDDYKILGVWDSYLWIFSLKTNAWKTLEYSFKYERAISALHLNGALHWCVGPKITAFNLAKEEIVFLDLPEGIKFVVGYRPVPLFDYQGSLCTSSDKSIWVMKEYGNSKSWAKLITSLRYNFDNPVGISRLGEAIFRSEGELGFVKSDIQGRWCGDDRSQIISFGDAFEYKESIISPKCFDKKT